MKDNEIVVVRDDSIQRGIAVIKTRCAKQCTRLMYAAGFDLNGVIFDCVSTWTCLTSQKCIVLATNRNK